MVDILILGNAKSIHTARWVRHLSRSYTITVLTFEPDQFVGVDVKRLWGGELGIFRYILAIPQLWYFLFRVKPKILHVYYAGGYGLMGAFSFFDNYFLSIWGSDVYLYPAKNKVKACILRFVLHVPKLVFSTSHDLANSARKIYDRHYEIIPFGVDCSEYRNMFHIDDEISGPRKIVIGTVKSLEYVYGIDKLLRTFSLVLERLPVENIELIIAGDGSERGDLERLTRELKIENKVKFLGRLPQEQVAGILNSFDIFVALSRSESFGVAILEASSCSLPVVVSAAGGIPEIVLDGETGFIIKNGDPVIAANKIVDLILDRDFRRDLGRRGREFTEKFYSWESSTSKFEEYIKSNI